MALLKGQINGYTMIQVIFSMVYNRVKIKGASSEVPFIKNIQLYKVYIETIVYYNRYIYKNNRK